MRFLVIAYPKMTPEDQAWVDEVRKQHDPIMVNIVRPHIPFVFPTSKLDASQLSGHIKSHMQEGEQFSVTFDSFQVVEDDSRTYTHTYFVPSDGYDEIVKLHDQFYTDELASELKPEIPFVPHMGIGSSVQRDAMEDLAKTLIKAGRSVVGHIDELVVCSYDGKEVNDVLTIALN